MNLLKAAILIEEEKINNVNVADQKKLEVKNSGEIKARKFAYDKILIEVVSIVNNLNIKYDISDDDDITRDEILKRKEMKGNYAAELDRLKTG